MKWKRSENTLFPHRKEFGLHGSFVDISYEDRYTVIMGMLSQTPYAGEYYASGDRTACDVLFKDTK